MNNINMLGYNILQSTILFYTSTESNIHGWDIETTKSLFAELKNAMLDIGRNNRGSKSSLAMNER